MLIVDDRHVGRDTHHSPSGHNNKSTNILFSILIISEIKHTGKIITDTIYNSIGRRWCLLHQ